MGASPSTNQPKTYIAHQRFNRCQIHIQKTHIDSLIPVDFSPFDFQYWKTQLQQLKGDQNSNLLFLPQSYDQKIPSFNCSSKPQLHLSFQNYPFLLEQQIKNRSASNQLNYFDEEELWMLLYSLLKSQRAFMNLSLKVGDIHPHNIFINEKGYPRLACQFSWPGEKTNFEKVYYDKIFRFLSPEQFDLCQQGQCSDICYTNTSEAFSIGLTLLSAGLLEGLDKICDMKTFKFNNKYLDYCLGRWMTLKYKHFQTNQIVDYSYQLKDIVKNLCNFNKNERYLSSKVYDILQPYENKIMKMEKFQLKNYKGLQKQLSPKVEIVTDHRKLFDKYAALQTNNEALNRNPVNNNTFTNQIFKGEQRFVDSDNNKPVTITYGGQGNLRRLEPLSTLQALKQRKAEELKRDLQLQFSQSRLQQKNQDRRLNIVKQEFSDTRANKNQTRYYQFKETYFQPPRISKSDVPLIESYKPNLGYSSQIGNSNFNTDILQKIQRQIRGSQENFPERNKV